MKDMSWPWGAFFALCIPFLVGCENEEKPSVTSFSQIQQPLDSLSIDEVIPAGNGGIYIYAGDIVWYAMGSTAMKVKTADGETLTPYDIIPTSGTGIYVEVVNNGDRLWYVDGAKAIPLREVINADQMDTVIPAVNMAVESYIKQIKEESKEREEQEAQDRELADPRY